MNFKIIYCGLHHVRLKASFALTLDIQDYLRRLSYQFEQIEQVTFYIDERHLLIQVTKGYDPLPEAQAFIQSIMPDRIKKLIALPIRKNEGAYTILSTSFIQRALYQRLVPLPIRYLRTLYEALKHMKAAHASLVEKQLTMEVLDACAIGISIFMNDAKTASSIMFLLRLGNKLDAWSMRQSLSDLEMSLQNADNQVWLVQGENRLQIKSSEVQVGDHLLVSEGNEILFDGTLIEGTGSVNESSLTGESFPIEKSQGSPLYSNTVLVSGELIYRVDNAQVNGRIQEMVHLMKTAEMNRETKQKHYIQLADRVVKYNFIGAALALLLTKSPLKAISFLLVDFSCALKISTPVAYLSTVKKALDQRIVVKSGEVFDRYRLLDTYLFDKTGTVTVSHPVVDRIIPFYDYTTEEVLRISACLEEHIHHPIANAVVDKAAADGVTHDEMHEQLYYIASKGIKSSINQAEVLIGNYLLMADEAVEITEEQLALINQYKQRYNLLYLGYDKRLIALLCIDTPLKTEAIATLSALQSLGKTTVLVTGDTADRTQAVVENLSFDHIYTDLKPEDKFAIIEQLQADGKNVLMVGDGLNDSAAISLADVGIVLHESADIARQVSDVILLDNDLNSLIILNQLSDKLHHLIKRNVKDTILVNGTLIGLGLFSFLSPATLSLLHNTTTLALVMRSMQIE